MFDFNGDGHTDTGEALGGLGLLYGLSKMDDKDKRRAGNGVWIGIAVLLLFFLIMGAFS